MGRFSIPEEVIGVPLWVPDAHNFFEIEDNALPNGDPCLVMRGDINAGYKAFLKAPIMFPKDVLNTSDHVASQEWAMSCWLKLVNLGSAPPNDAAMFGCSSYDSDVNTSITGVIPGAPFALLAYQQQGFYYYRYPLNNAGTDSSRIIRFFAETGNTNFHMFQDYWFLFVINHTQTFSSPNYTVTATVYMDTYANGLISDGAVGAASGSYTGPRYLHIGGYGPANTGRPDLWRMAKWAFHDHALTRAERIQMWQAMYGTDLTFADDFNRAGIGTNWRSVAGGGISITSNQITSPSASTLESVWVKDLGSEDIYCECDIVSMGNDGWARVEVRCPNYGADNNRYMGGWSETTNEWQIIRQISGETVLAATSSGPPSFPCTIRLESETVAGDVVLRLYHDGALKLSHTDSSGSKIINQTNVGLSLRGGSSQTTVMDNFECGTL